MGHTLDTQQYGCGICLKAIITISNAIIVDYAVRKQQGGGGGGGEDVRTMGGTWET